MSRSEREREGASAREKNKHVSAGGEGVIIPRGWPKRLGKKRERLSRGGSQRIGGKKKVSLESASFWLLCIF